MATHILWEADVADFDAWYEIFKQDRYNRRSAGINVMHVWHDQSKLNHAVVVFRVADIEKASAFLSSEELAVHLARDGVTNIHTRTLNPA
ncbi:MAG: hypothetical protein N4A61_03435 [Pelagimonas sp.]|jgi:hypothetical protein|nr:hypothetical protein [Pelagimonas sp.]